MCPGDGSGNTIPRVNGSTAGRGTFTTYEARLLDRREIAEGTMAFDFSRPEGFSFRAGQAVTLTLPDLAPTDARGNRRVFSIASAPADPVLTVAMRMRNSAFKNALRTMRLQTPLRLAGPTGRFTLDPDDTRPAVLIAGGIGITPFISILKDAFHNAVRRQLWLFYSNRTPASSAFMTELVAMARKNDNFHFIPTMSGTDSELSDWQGRRGTIDLAMLQRHCAVLPEASCYIAGPTPMVEAMQDLLAAAGVPEARIHLDQFFGY